LVVEFSKEVRKFENFEIFKIKAIKPIFWKTKIQGNQLITSPRYNSLIYNSKLDYVYKLFVYIEKTNVIS